jgi:dephospho-CoA kinase
MTVIIALSGKTASGKTSVGKALAAQLPAPFVSFGNFVRARAIALHAPNPTDRITLQSLGERLISELGWLNFCLAVLDQTRWRDSNFVIVDGVRHAECISTLCQIAPSRLVYLAVPDEERADRLQIRGETTVPATDLHSTEVQVRDTLPALADLILNSAEASPEEHAARIVAWLQNQTNPS